MRESWERRTPDRGAGRSGAALGWAESALGVVGPRGWEEGGDARVEGARWNWRASGPTSWVQGKLGASDGLSGEGMRWKLVE